LGGQRAAAPAGANPALGLRAVRLSLKDPALFRPQLRAILRASAYGPARIMIPMLSSMHELSQVLRILEECKRELEKKGLRYDADVQIGGMIEVPAAALAAEAFARHLDFLSIGTNDLIQYTIAADRIDDEVNYLYDPLHPAVLRLIHMTLRAARRRDIPVSMCGEMAGDVRYTRLLLGMGLKEFSMHPSALSEVKAVIQSSDVGDAEKWARKILRNLDSRRIEAYLESLNTGLDM
jgi:phosphotransferase system enzyme I (PtsI)